MRTTSSAASDVRDALLDPEKEQELDAHPGRGSPQQVGVVSEQNRSILGESAAEVFGQRTANKKLQVLLSQITEHIPTDVVIFDVSTDRGIKSGNQTLTEIMYKLFLQSLGYAGDLDLAELEITLEQKDELGHFKQTYRELFDQEWDENKDLIAFYRGGVHRFQPVE